MLFNNLVQMPLLVKKLTENATLPTRGSKYSAGLDLYSAYDYIVNSHGKCLVKTDLTVVIEEGHYGRVAPRSGLASKNFIDVGAGVIDSDYRGNVCILLFNHSDVDYHVKKGDRVAQLIIEKIDLPDIVEVTGDLDSTSRNSGGFGSTGI